MVAAIDDDGEILFDEFLKLVKGGSKTKAAMGKFMNDDANNDSDVIFNFFQKLTHGDLQPDKTMKVGFGVYYGQERRKKILDAILGGKNPKEKDNGKKILANYRLQLSEQMIRVKQNKEEMIDQGIRVTDPSELEMINFMNKRAEAFDRNDIDPDNFRKLLEGITGMTPGRH